MRSATTVVKSAFSFYWNICAAGGVALGVFLACSLLSSEIEALGFGWIEATYYFCGLGVSLALIAISPVARAGWKYVLIFLVVPFLMIGSGLVGRDFSAPTDSMPDIRVVLSAGMTGLFYIVPVGVIVLLLAGANEVAERKYKNPSQR